MTIDEVDMIRDMLIEYKSPQTVYQLLKDSGKLPNVNLSQITGIKLSYYDHYGYIRSWKYTINELKTFMNDNRMQQSYTVDEIEHFCDALIKNNYDINLAYHQLINEGYKILRCTLYSLLKMKTHKEITEKYFKGGD